MRISGHRMDNYSRDDLQKKTGPINISMLRMKMVNGLMGQFVDVAIQDYVGQDKRARTC
jgi:hypothetical protein